MTNSTVANNETPYIGNYEGGKINLQNTILQSNGFSNLALGGSFVLGEIVSLSGNLLSDDALAASLNNMDKSSTDPLFETGTFQLSEDSPAVDAGFITDDVPEFDLAGNARVQGGCIDIGANESSFDAGTACVTSTREVLAYPSLISIYPNPVAEIVHIAFEND
ncbi:MAG: hypothetical protein ACI9XO_004277 [Paraglaciecola sp.]|jgi:hypothetical protein